MTWNPFDWTAGPFLALYMTLAAGLIALGFRLRSTIGPARQMTGKVNALELAFLAGGAPRLGDAVLFSLASGKGATIDPINNSITVADQRPLATLMDRPPLLPVRPNMTRRQFQTAIEPLVARVRGRLQTLGCYPTAEQMAAFRMNTLPFVGLLLAFGTTKAVVGAERHHPVGILLVLVGLTAFAGIILAMAPARTRAGNTILRTYREAHARAARAPLDHELLLAVALSGAVVLSGTDYAPVYAASQTMKGDGGGGCGGGGGGDGGGGGCGGCS